MPVDALYLQPDYRNNPRSSVKTKGLKIQLTAYYITQKEKENAIIIELSVAPDDMGKVIGKQGRIAKAIRTVVKAAASKENKKYLVEIV